MYTLICYLVYGFIPKWETIEESNLHNSNGVVIGRTFTLRCEKTGRIKRKVCTNDTWF